jgi:hypothetical protein
MTRRHLISLAAAAFAVLASAAASAAGPDRLATARAATAGYHQIGAALGAGYGLFPDAAGIACIAEPGMGAMGIHYANGALFANPAIDAAKPEVLVYEPKRNGKLRLVALEYVVVKAAWDATHSSPPSLFGQTFNFSGAGNRYGLPPFYSLHAWIWKHNPAGMFAPFNPNVSCAAA